MVEEDTEDGGGRTERMVKDREKEDGINGFLCVISKPTIFDRYTNR